MWYKRFKIIISLFSLLLFCNGIRADTTHVEFKFDTSLNRNKFFITVNNGIDNFKIDPGKENGWKGKLYAPYGYIEVGYNTSDSTFHSCKFFFDDKNVNIWLTHDEDPEKCFKVDKMQTSGVVTYEEMGGALLDSFVKPEFDTLLFFYQQNKAHFDSNPDLVTRFFSLGDSASLKKVKFVEKYPDLYVSCWIFQNEIVKYQILSVDTIVKIYNTLIPDYYKKSEAGTDVLKKLNNRKAINSTGVFSEFSVPDIKGEKIESQRLLGNYVLIQIWASWCMPCRAEIPTLKEINDKYKEKNFRLISFSIDTDRDAFMRDVALFSMDWSQVFGDRDVYNKLASVPIPQIYLIDPTGNTVYNKDKAKDFDLSKLKELLSKYLD